MTIENSTAWRDRNPRGVLRLGRSPQTHTMRTATERMDALLSAKNISVRVTLPEDSIVVGRSIPSEVDPVEFSFTSRKQFERLFRSLRLMDFAMAYFDGVLTITGPITKAVDILDTMNLAMDRRQTRLEFYGRLLISGFKLLVPKYARKFESLDHYSQPAEAYEKFLDNCMQYTCGRFETGDEDIDQAQIAKFHLIERMFRKYAGPLTGKDHLDVGCGWGGMANYFQTEFGTRSLGNTNSDRQAKYAEGRYGIEVVLSDFYELRNSGRCFDLITVVGMIEHLMPHRRSQLLHLLRDILKPEGLVYLQCIAKPPTWIGGDAYRVASRLIFPGHYLETPKQTATRIRDCGFTILEECNHHHDYALTIVRWVEAIQRNEKAMIKLVGPRWYRIYLGYLSYASKLFAAEDRGCLMRYTLRKR